MTRCCARSRCRHPSASGQRFDGDAGQLLRHSPQPDGRGLVVRDGGEGNRRRVAAHLAPLVRVRAVR